MTINIDVYYSQYCGYCHRAKMLLDNKGVKYNEISVDNQPEKRAEMIERSGGITSVPQIFIKNEHVGGCDDLYALESQGTLDEKLGLVT